MPESTPKPITIPLPSLSTNTIPFSTLESAFGPHSLGILIISNLPATFPALRHKLLSYASHIASLPPTTLNSLVSSSSKYLVGWSHGRETLPPKSLPDYHKGSYYVNCAFYQDPELQAAPPTKDFPDFPEYTSLNLWPQEDQLPGFREAMVEVCALVIDVAALVARNIDRYASVEVEGYPEPDAQGRGYLEAVVRGSYTTKARLLHYFPPESSTSSSNGEDGESGGGEDDDWCATHLDHGCLTGLLSAMYLDANTLPPLPALPDAIPCPDETAGLYIHSRAGKAVRVTFPPDCLAFQTGEALQKITEGRFRAVPHYVSPGRDKGAMRGVARNTLAVFTQPNLEDCVDRKTGECFGGFARGVVKRNTVEG